MSNLTDLPVANWLQHRQFDLIADYLRRGRTFSEVEATHLNIRWLESVVAWAQHYDCAGLRDQAGDIQSELLLRRMQPPWRLVAPVLRDIERRARRATVVESPAIREQRAAQLIASLRGVNADGSRATRH